MIIVNVREEGVITVPDVEKFRATVKELDDQRPSTQLSQYGEWLYRRVELLTRIVEELIVGFGNLESDESALEAEEAQLAASEASLRSAVTTDISDVQAEIDALKAQLPDPTVVGSLDAKLQALKDKYSADAAAVDADTGTVQSADPGPAAPPSPAPGP